MVKRGVFVLAFAMALGLAGCSSTKLNDVPVQDLRGGAQGAGAGAGAGASTVRPVQADGVAGDTAGPVGVERVIYFDYDSYTIKPDYQTAIDGNARFLKANPQRRVSLEGHTDERGGREYNLALGQKRAEAVRRALTLLGVNDAQLEAISFGKEKPAVQGSDEDAWAQNRRVEFSYR
ncbi:MAG: peptidoglycan-associated lipoprotein Pal [Variovorax sp.]